MRDTLAHWGKGAGVEEAASLFRAELSEYRAASPDLRTSGLVAAAAAGYEDRSFFRRPRWAPPLSPAGLFRALGRNLRGIPEGGSTIPQQLAKSYLRGARRGTDGTRAEGAGSTSGVCKRPAHFAERRQRRIVGPVVEKAHRDRIGQQQQTHVPACRGEIPQHDEHDQERRLNGATGEPSLTLLPRGRHRVAPAPAAREKGAHQQDAEKGQARDAATDLH